MSTFWIAEEGTCLALLLSAVLFLQKGSAKRCVAISVGVAGAYIGLLCLIYQLQVWKFWPHIDLMTWVYFDEMLCALFIAATIAWRSLRTADPESKPSPRTLDAILHPALAAVAAFLLFVGVFTHIVIEGTREHLRNTIAPPRQTTK